MTNSADYVLARTEAEYARLRLQARFWEPATRALLAEAGLAPGMTCLDAGCGPGEVMRLMAGIVGATGHVTGLDADAVLGRHMIADLAREAAGPVSFVAGDVMAAEAIAGAPFDLVFARLLLLHMPDPVAAVRRLAALVRPGGRLVLMDYDMTRLAVRPEAAAPERAFTILTEVFVRTGRFPDMGLRLPSLLADAGLPPPRGTRADASFAPLALLGPMLRSVLASLAGPATAFGVTTATELADVLGGVEALEKAGRHHGLFPLMIGVWTEV